LIIFFQKYQQIIPKFYKKLLITIITYVMMIEESKKGKNISGGML
jgi:hypothetical protein